MAAISAGAIEVADGITTGGTYAYAPPPAFHLAGEPSVEAIFDIRDFGAVAGADIDSRPMIQAAIDAAHEAGGGLVYIPPGVWGITASPDGYGSIHLQDNVFLKGAGMGVSTLRLVDGSSDDITGLVRSEWGVETSNWGIADFTIDGNKANTTGTVDGFFTGPMPGSELADRDVQVLRIEIQGVSRYGFDPHEQTERLSIKDSVAHDNAVDGFVLDFITDGELTGNVAYDNGRHGFNFVTSTSDMLVADNVAHDNGGAGFVVQRGSENIQSPHGITFEGGASYGNGREGVLVQIADNVTISGMSIHDNGMAGIRLYGASSSTVTGNDLHDNSQAAPGAWSEILISSYDDTAYGLVHDASYNLIEGNTISSTAEPTARYGIEERAGDTNYNELSGNVISGTTAGPVSLTGADSFSLLRGTAGDDVLVGSSVEDHVIGGDGNDQLWGGDADDVVEGGTGADLISGGKGNDIVDGGAGDDDLSGNTGNDHLLGGDGQDRLSGDAGDDLLDGGAGDDLVLAGSGNDVVVADAGNDTLDGGSGFDTLDFANAGDAVYVDLAAKMASGLATGDDVVTSFEQVLGSAFADQISGDKNANTLVGGAGNDELRGAAGADVLVGGEGADTFWWAVKDVMSKGVHQGVDRIVDFDVAEDHLDIGSLASVDGWTRIGDVVRLTDRADGTMLSVKMDGVFQDVALLENVHGVSAAALYDNGTLLA
jgi:parallel beta-helix repeat protein